MTYFSKHLVSMAILGSCLMILTACTTGPLSGSAAMRIEVDVYRGPLSEEPEMQWYALLGQLEEAERSFERVDNFARAVIAYKDFNNLPPSDYSGEANEWPVPRIREKPVGKNDLFNAITLNLENSEKITPEQKRNLKFELDQIFEEYKFEHETFISNVENNKTYNTKINNQTNTLEEAELTILTGNSAFEWQRILQENDGILYNLCEYLDPEGIWDVIDFTDCIILTAIISDAKDIRNDIAKIKRTHKQWFESDNNGVISVLDFNKVTVFLGQISRLSITLRDKAFRWAIGSVVGQSLNVAVRASVVNLIVASSENGNQLKNRADALMKQMLPYGNDRRELPPSVALREAEPTDFINVYKWLGASTPGFFTSNNLSVGSVGDRVKMVERLISDQYWSKINTVYASGRGKVSMAFIKDEVGNWNLKSFDNDPSELLHAYTTVSLEALKKAAELAAAGSSGGGSAAGQLAIDQLIKLADQSAFNGAPASRSSEISAILDGLHKDLTNQLTKQETELKSSSSREEQAEILAEIKASLNTYNNFISGLAKGLLYQNQPVSKPENQQVKDLSSITSTEALGKLRESIP